ncbi:MAG: hypothetical protein KIT31_39640 [Deltaproteobacteria bacterium]|nr:hypothetical protein [Deltaproteobacteria bacterium]
MRGSLGLVIGLVVGAGGMYLVLRPPWAGRGDETAPTEPRGSAAAAGKGSGSGKPPKKKPPDPRGASRPHGGAARPASSTDGANDEATFDEPAAPALTDGDRRMEWRGDDVTLPPRTVDMASGTESRTLDDGEINATIGAQSGGVRDCIVQGAKGTDLRASITIVLVVDGTGRVTRSRLEAPRYLFDKGNLLTCAQRALRQMKFPATGAPTKVTFPAQLG